MATSRSQVVSSFTIVKGTLIDETRAVLAAWDLDATKRDNLARVRSENSVGARSATWLRDVGKVLNRRLDPSGRDRPLARLARSRCALDVWRPLLLWHTTRDEFLLRDFLVNWLFPHFDNGTFALRPLDLEPYLASLATDGRVEHTWADTTRRRVATALLQAAGDFGLLTGGSVKRFTSYHLPDESFLYLLHAIRGQDGAAHVIDSPEWRLFLMRPIDVERELLRLHQRGAVEFHLAGSLFDLTLPCATADEYAERLAA